MKRPAVLFPEGPNGRQVCTATVAGRREYTRRVQLMRDRQQGLCAICGCWLAPDEASFDHQHGRGMGAGHRDDRCEVDGVPQNAAAHAICNYKRGSTRAPYLIQPHEYSDRHLEEMSWE